MSHSNSHPGKNTCFHMQVLNLMAQPTVFFSVSVLLASILYYIFMRPPYDEMGEYDEILP